MAIGNTKVEKLINRHLLLSETVAWIEAFDNLTKEQIIEWIQNEQLTKKGVNKFNEVIGLYSYATELASKGRKKQGTHYTLFDTGDFYRSMYVVVTGEELIINANPQKEDENLFQKFGTAIIGLNEENFTKLKEIVKQKQIEYANKVLFGN